MPSPAPYNATVFASGSIGATATSSSFSVLSYNYVGLQVSTKAGSTLAGTWKIEVSNDGGANWADITSGFTPALVAVSSGASSQFAQCTPIAAALMRITFTRTSGTGEVIAAVTLKASTN